VVPAINRAGMNVTGIEVGIFSVHLFGDDHLTIDEIVHIGLANVITGTAR
jgi:hypothetical protein